MQNETELVTALATVSAHLKTAVVDRDNYRKWWQDEQEKVATRDEQITALREEIDRINVELNNLRDTGTIVVHDHAVKEAT